MLHLLPRVDLTSLLPAGLHDAFRTLQSRVGSWPAGLQGELDARSTCLRVDALVATAHELKASVASKLEGLPTGSSVARNSRWFLANIDAIVTSLHEIDPCILVHYLPGTRFTGSLSKAGGVQV